MGETIAFQLEPAAELDFEPLLAVRLRAMRESLERLGRFDEARARARLAASFAPEHTQHIVVQGQRVGFLVLKPLSRALRLDHLYIDPAFQRRGIGHAVMQSLCQRADREQMPVELCALKLSAANSFYLRHGFVLVGEGEWDLDYLRLPPTDSMRAVRSLWQAIAARDWAAARALLHDGLQTVRWASGERLGSADAYIAAQTRNPDPVVLHVLELCLLQDGRILGVLRLDTPAQQLFVTLFCRLDDGRIAGIDEYWSAAPPPAPGAERFDPGTDPRGFWA